MKQSCGKVHGLSMFSFLKKIKEIAYIDVESLQYMIVQFLYIFFNLSIQIGAVCALEWSD